MKDTKLDEIVKNTIGEVEAEIVAASKKSEVAQQSQEAIQNIEKKAVEIAVKDSDEVEFLKNVKERIEVLFHGLNQADDTLELRLELNIKFLEFLLAKIEHRLQTIQK